MLVTSVGIDQQSLDRMLAAVGGSERAAGINIKVALRQTMNFAARQMARQLSRTLKITQRGLLEHGIQKEVNDDGAGLRLRPTARIPLREFDARQVGERRRTTPKRVMSDAQVLGYIASGMTRRSTTPPKPRPKNPAAGVTYQIMRQGSRRTATQAFIVSKFDGHVYGRPEGAKRLPMRRLKGPSPWGAYVDQELLPELSQMTQERLAHELQRRIDFVRLLREGAIQRGGRATAVMGNL
jgi:hypothetical protein